MSGMHAAYRRCQQFCDFPEGMARLGVDGLDRGRFDVRHGELSIKKLPTYVMWSSCVE